VQNIFKCPNKKRRRSFRCNIKSKDLCDNYTHVQGHSQEFARGGTNEAIRGRKSPGPGGVGGRGAKPQKLETHANFQLRRETCTQVPSLATPYGHVCTFSELVGTKKLIYPSQLGTLPCDDVILVLISSGGQLSCQQ